MRSSIFEPPPPTAQTVHARDPKFCMVGPQGTRLRVIEAIFEFRPGSRDMGTFRGFWGVKSRFKNCHFFAYISAPRTKFKNRLDGPKYSSLGTYQAQFGIFSMFCWEGGEGNVDVGWQILLRTAVPVVGLTWSILRSIEVHDLFTTRFVQVSIQFPTLSHSSFLGRTELFELDIRKM